MSRFKADGGVEAGFFLLDVFSLGVKDAGFHQFSSIPDYQDGLVDRFFPDRNAVRMTPEAARKLTEDTITYGRDLDLLRAPITKRRVAFLAVSKRRTAMSNLSSVKATNHSTSRDRTNLRRASREFCACSKPGAAKTATISPLPVITSNHSTAQSKTAEATSLRLQKSETVRELSPESEPGR